MNKKESYLTLAGVVLVICFVVGLVLYHVNSREQCRDLGGTYLRDLFYWDCYRVTGKIKTGEKDQ